MSSWKDLFPEAARPPIPPSLPPSSSKPLPSSSRPSYLSTPLPPPSNTKTFAQALKNACDIPVSQLPTPCIKGDAMAIKIPEEEYKAGLESCNNNLHRRLILVKGEQPIKVVDLLVKLLSLWKPIGNWKLVPIGRGYYEFSFSSIEDLRRVLSVGSWNVNPGTLRLFRWTPDFSPSLVKQSNVQCWIRILGLPPEYWRPRIIFAIARGVGIPFSLDDGTINKTLGHFARVLVDIDLLKPIQEQILVEREDYAFLVRLEYENLPFFYSACKTIGHQVEDCFKMRRNCNTPVFTVL